MELKDIISSGFLEHYVSGLSSQQEALQVQSWAADYPEVRQELLEIELALETYASSQAIQPTPGLKDKIFNTIVDLKRSTSDNALSPTSINKNGTVRQMNSFYKFLAAASIVLLVISIVFAYSYYNKYNDAKDKLQVSEQNLQRETELAQAMDSDIGVMENKYSKPVVLNGTAHAPDALAKIYWMTNSGEVWVDAGNLPKVPTGKQYQLWAIVDGKPVDAGMIPIVKGKYHVQKMKTFGKADAFAITMEDSGGSPTPKGDMVVIAKI